VITRFGTAKEKGQKIKDAYGNEKKIVAVDVFNDENYILATILDPRFKTFPFDGMRKYSNLAVQKITVATVLSHH